MFHGESKVFNQKINCMRASGYFLFDGKRYEFNPTADFGTLDWGRGVWTYDNTWYWGSGNWLWLWQYQCRNGKCHFLQWKGP